MRCTGTGASQWPLPRKHTLIGPNCDDWLLCLCVSEGFHRNESISILSEFNAHDRRFLSLLIALTPILHSEFAATDLQQAYVRRYTPDRTVNAATDNRHVSPCGGNKGAAARQSSHLQARSATQVVRYLW